jgi:hypothetical protein
LLITDECPQEPTLPCHNPLDQVKTNKLELYKDTMEVELEEFNMLQEELVTVKGHECRQGKFRSSDGHTYHVESDVAKQYVTFLFGEEEEEPVTREMVRHAKKAAKRARQRSVVEEELYEFYMPQEEPETIEHLEAVMSVMEGTYREHRQGMKPSMFQSTDGHIFKVEGLRQQTGHLHVRRRGASHQ